MQNMKNPLKFIFISICMASLVSGCFKVGPDYVRPPVNVAENWVDENDPRVKREPIDNQKWWQTFGDPVLDQLIETAYRENLTLRIAGLRVLQFRALLGVSKGEFFPQSQQAFGNIQRNRISARSPLAAGANTHLNYTQDEFGLQALWELDFWGRFRRGIESASAGWFASVADYNNALVTLTADVANAYISIRALEKRIAIALQNVETQKENLKIVEARYKFGTASQLDVQQATLVLNNTLAFIPTLEAQLQQAKDALSLLLGMPPGKLADALGESGGIPVSPAVIVMGIPIDLLRRRPDIRSAELAAMAQGAQIGVAKSELYPALSLTGTFGFLSSNVGTFKLSDIFQWRSRMAQFGPSVQWNIFNYGQITNNVRVQDALFEQQLAAYQNAVLRAQQEVEDSLAAFLKAQDRAVFLEKSTAAAKSALDLAMMQYREGVTDFTSVLIAEQALLTEQDNLASTLGAISTSLVGVYRALGGGWETREKEELVPREIMEKMVKRTNWGKLLEATKYNPNLLEPTQPIIPIPDW
jgi:NodT family efflux transporter outer membrane factor (OMF) lipoprotein